MPKVASLDTNLVVQLLVTREYPEISEAVVRAIEANQMTHLADLAITESVFVLSKHYRIERKAIAGFFRALFKNPRINCNVSLFNKAFDYFINHPALSFEDCCLVAYAELNNASPLLTNDRTLAKQLPHAELIKA